MLSTSGDLLFTAAFEMGRDDTENISVHPAAFVDKFLMTDQSMRLQIGDAPQKEVSCTEG